MAKSKTDTTYFEGHKKLLHKIIDDYQVNCTSINLFATNDYAIFNNIETGITKHTLRKYQMEALYILDYLLRCSHERPEKKQLLEEIDKENKIKVPFMSFEMATGSGKTMLMGASIYFLNQKFGIDNFLIITPASTDIYQKTIRNFIIGGYDSVWADDTPFTFNLITGDNYSQNLFFDKSKDANIFVFNISKFGTNATNTEKTWESAVWQDDQGNSISIKQFLKDKKLVIITDEAHHHQTPVAKKIIYNFRPTAVLEYTATAIEIERGQDKKNQQIVYKYDIRRFLEDGHGKLVRAVALASASKKTKDEIAQSEKLKIITLFLIHLLKKKAVLQDPKCRGLKPLAFVKVKEETSYTKKIFDYIQHNLANDLENINTIIEKVKVSDLMITSIIQELYTQTYNNDLESLQSDIQKAANTAIFYYANSDKETEKKFLNIRKNEVEVVVYMQRLDEGIDLPNIYTMAVINDNESNFKTSVKQIIGRGVRLNKDKREFDDHPDELVKQSEMLHVVCDQGKNFEEVIESIQKEFGLNNKYLSFDKPRKPIINKVKSELLNGKYIPHIKADFKAKEGVNLIALVSDTETVVNNFIKDNCFTGELDEVKSFLKYRPDSFFLEVDIFADKKEYHKQLQQSGGIPKTLVITEKEMKSIYGAVQKILHCLPDTDTIRKAFQSYMYRINEKGLQYYCLDDADERLAKKLFVDSFSFFYRNHIERNYFRLDFHQINDTESWNLAKNFKDYELKIPEDQIENKFKERVKEKSKIIQLIDENVHFYGYDKSAYDYEKFDSYTEFQLARYINEVLKKVTPDREITYITVNEPELSVAAEPEVLYGHPPTNFWIRNQRNIYFTYGSKKYYPDFIAYRDGKIFVIEAKGEVFSDSMKNALLEKLEEATGRGHIKTYQGILVFSSLMDKMGSELWEFQRFIDEAKDAIKRQQSKDELHLDPPLEERFVNFIPVYSPDKAYRKFNLKQKTPKPVGWYKVDPRKEKYPESVFATQVKGSDLLPHYDPDSWMIFDSNFETGDAVGNLVLYHHESDDKNYEGMCTIRKFDIREETSKHQLFPEKIIYLEALNEDILPIIIEGITSDDEIEIIGIEYKQA